MKLSQNQEIVIRETIRYGGRSAHTQCRTMKALEKKGLVILINPNLGIWQATDLAKKMYS